MYTYSISCSLMLYSISCSLMLTHMSLILLALKLVLYITGTCHICQVGLKGQVMNLNYFYMRQKCEV